MTSAFPRGGNRDPRSLGAIVVNFNGGEKIVECIQALRGQAVPLRDIVVVDNGSTDASVAWLRAETPDVRIVELGENRGIAFARNVGLKTLGTELALSVDSDVNVADDCLEKLVRAFVRHKVAIVCPRILLLPEANFVQCDGASLHFLGTLALRHACRPADSLPGDGDFVGGCIGACMLLDRRIALEAGGFNEQFFFYFEDLEFCLRLRARGHRIYCEPAAVVYHDRGQGTPGLSWRGDGSYPPRRAYLSMRHRWLAILIHYRLRTIMVLFPALVLYELATVGASITRGWLHAWGQAWWWLLLHRNEVCARRKRAQAARTTGDRELLEGGPIPLAAGFIRSAWLARCVAAFSALLNAYWVFARKLAG